MVFSKMVVIGLAMESIHSKLIMKTLQEHLKLFYALAGQQVKINNGLFLRS